MNTDKLVMKLEAEIAALKAEVEWLREENARLKVRINELIEKKWEEEAGE